MIHKVAIFLICRWKCNNGFVTKPRFLLSRKWNKFKNRPIFCKLKTNIVMGIFTDRVNHPSEGRQPTRIVIESNVCRLCVAMWSNVSNNDTRNDELFYLYVKFESSISQVSPYGVGSSFVHATHCWRWKFIDWLLFTEMYQIIDFVYVYVDAFIPGRVLTKVCIG